MAINKNSEYVINFVKNRKQNLISVFDNKCCICGFNSYPEALDFHHINPEEKEDRIARMISNNYSLDKIKEEMKKCIVLCSNCHREFHHYEKTKGITLEQFLKQSRILIGRESGFDPE